MVPDLMAQHVDGPLVGAVQAQDASQEHGLAGAGAPDHAEDFVAPHVQVEVVVNHLPAEPVDQPADRDDVFGPGVHQNPIRE